MTDKPRYRLQADGKVRIVTDGIQNLVANLGTSRDKASASGYYLNMIDDQQLMAAYRGTWLARKIVDIPAFDAFREWRTWQADPKEAKLLLKEERRLSIQGKLLRAKISARLLGGAALLIGDGALDTSKPLDPTKMAKGGLKYVTLLHRRHLSPGEYDRDVTSEYFDQPKHWTLSTVGGAGIKIHPTRLVMFKGAEVPDESYSSHYVGWGDSVLLAAMEAVRNMDATSANVASLIFEAKVDTVGVPNLMAQLMRPDYEAQLTKRFLIAERGKSVNGTLIHDTEELIGQKQANFSSLADIIDRFMQLASGAADIPMTRLLGQSPAGMNATGDSDIRNYYDRIAAIQTLEISPATRILDECIVQSALGGNPDELEYKWSSLWQLDAKELALIGKTQADTVKVLSDTGLFPDQPLGEAAVQAMTDSGSMPGLDHAMKAYFAENPDEEFGAEKAEAAKAESEHQIEAAGMLANAKASAAQPQQKPADKSQLRAADAAPATLYIHRKVLNGAEILGWAKAQGFTEALEQDDLHVTICCSRSPVDWMKVGESWEDEIKVAAGGPRIMERFGDATVLLFASSRLCWRHEDIKRFGASHDYPDYQPHITISYSAAGLDLSTVKPYAGEIVLGPEIFEELNESWREEKGP
jgi:hypothetical protein